MVLVVGKRGALQVSATFLPWAVTENFLGAILNNNMKKNEISINALRKAVATLRDAIQQPKNEFTRDATIQRFEYTFELAWKTLKRYFSITQSPQEMFAINDIFREAGRQGIIESVERWFEFKEARNLTAHTYNVETAEEAYEAAKRFLPDVEKLVSKLEKLIV